MVTCKEYVKIKKEELKNQIETLGIKPTLCVVQIGEDPASCTYIKGKSMDCEELGTTCKHIHITDVDGNDNESVQEIIRTASNDDDISGIILQLPIPKKFDVQRLQKAIAPEKDVDGFLSESEFIPCTPKGIIDYLKYNNIDFLGKECVVIGRSEIVGRPLVNLLISEGATVISCNSKTPDIKKFTQNADIIISAIGKSNYFDESYFGNDQVIVDVGINRDKNGKLCGDIVESVKQNALLATPVPGGVGLLTRLALMENTVNAALNSK